MSSVSLWQKDNRMKQINVGIVGFGTVGSSTARILLRERERNNKSFGLDCRIT